LDCSVRWGYRSWPCTRPRGPRSSFRPSPRSPVNDPPTARVGPPPLRFSAPSTRSTRGVHFPANPSRRTHARRSDVDLVAGVQARSGPPSPFFTASTVCSSSCPVTCFSHSRPWGWAPVPLLPAHGVVSRPRRAGVGGELSLREVPGRPGRSTRFRAPPAWGHRSGRVSDRSGSGSPFRFPDRHPSPTCRSRCPFGDRAAPLRPRGGGAGRLSLRRTAATRCVRRTSRGCLSRKTRPVCDVLPPPGVAPTGCGTARAPPAHPGPWSLDHRSGYDVRLRRPWRASGPEGSIARARPAAGNEDSIFT
jgi:hypothetical protein